LVNWETGELNARHGILEDLRSDRKGRDCSRLLPSNCSTTDLNLVSPCGRRSRPFQRGAAERQAWNERIYLAAIIRLWLRRAEGLAAYGPHMHTDCAFAEVQQDRNLLAMPANIN
jgi:hypothetical protein